MKNKVWLLIKTSRPLGWAIGPIVFFCGTVISGANLNLWALLQALFLSFPYCLFLYGINDVYDYESDKLNPRKNLLEGIKLETKDHSLIKKYSFYAAVLLVLSSLAAFKLSNFIAMFLLLFFSYFYSAPFLRFKEKPPLDSLANGVLYFLAPFMLGYSFGGSLAAMPIKVYFVMLCAMGVHSFSTIMDYTVDKKIGDKTFSVIYGKRAAAVFSFLMIVLTLLFAGIQTNILKYYLWFVGALFLIIAFYPSEKIASKFFKLVFIGFIAAGLVFLI